MAGDWIKRKEREKAAQMALYHAVVAAAPASYKQVAADQTAFGSGLAYFVSTLDEVDAAREMLRSKVEAKDLAEAAITDLFRSQVGKIQADNTITPAAKGAAGIPIHDETRTPGGTPEQRPEVQVNVVGQVHHITIVDSVNRKATRPPEARTIALYRAVLAAGAPLPLGIDGMELLGQFTASRLSLTYAGAEIGRTVVYAARYVGARNQLGPAGTVTAASVAA
jgi:hypothetical protein